jgi:hypothetical protein
MTQAYQASLALTDTWPNRLAITLDGWNMSILMVLSEPRIKFAKVDQNSKSRKQPWAITPTCRAITMSS